MELSAHRVTNVTVKVTIHDKFTVKEIRFIDGDANVVNIKLFGGTNGELQFIHEDTIDARENALC
jgi:DNA-binding cell septation regulator SpoVG